MGKRRYGVLALGWLAAALGAPSCGGDSEFSSTGGGSQTQASACAEYAEVGCRLDVECLPHLTAIAYGSEAACRERVEALCNAYFGLEGSNLTPEGLAVCSGALDALACEDLYTDELGTACDAFKGDHAAGEPCASGIQCMSGNCSSESSGGCGTCDADEIGPGEPCSPGGTGCTKGHYCDGMVCAPQVGPGGACDATAPCGAPLMCIDGQCSQGIQDGGACDPNVPSCDAYQGLVCSDASQVCVPWVIATEGAPCGDVGGTGNYVFCGAGTWCDSPGGTEGTCMPSTPDGGSCTATEDHCLAGAQCSGGKCAIVASCP